MKCPKCGYLGFETTDRCRNCGYDFSFTAPAASAELPLRVEASESPLADLDLRNGVGGDELARAVPDGPVAPVPDAPPEPAGDDLPLFAPRPAGTPLAVRRAGSDVPRARRTTTRPVRVDAPALPLGGEALEEPVLAPAQASEAPALAGLGARLFAASFDLGLLLALDVAVLWVTLRIAGLDVTREDLLVIRPIPMAAFLLILKFLYFVGFTVGGGQTMGKMLTGIRVTGDEGRGVDLTGAVVRAFGCLAALLTLGLLYVPVLLSANRRAVHDRLAGTRVVVA